MISYILRMNLLESEYEYLMEPTNGDPLLEIIQSAVTIGKLQSMLDTVDYTSLTACQDILHRCYEARECLLRLRTDGLLGEDPSDNECAANYFQPINEAVPSSTLLFGPPYHFSSSDHVALYMMFWGVQMLFQRLIYRARSIFQLHTDITRSGFQEDLSHSYFFENQEISLPGVYANRIARAVPYCLQESLKNTCHRPILFSLSGVSAYCVEIGDRRKFDWCQEVFKHTEARGTGTSAHLFALANSRWERRQEMGRNQFVCLSLRSQTYNSLCNVMPPALPKACSGIGGTSAYHSDGPIVAEIFE
ncbi:uncharacterized protein N7483_007472 [Penicillium malachiteum]|uniref:uncharacterized protein n=1 Tax=Penicillium malachiteum TaxID=1324776 RepID=UPI0025485CFD|nr:uncharacterized protein N7483_007472 [Penicillium malachiteum]KAJ5726115.1 hypothetical protein N7483_007472 [Penicillium malachiteum]